MKLPDSANLGRALNKAMEDIEMHNPDLADALPKIYGAVGDGILRELIKTLAPLDIGGDAFGHVYEYFMGENFPPTRRKLLKHSPAYCPGETSTGYPASCHAGKPPAK